MKEIIKRNYIVEIRGRLKPEIKPRNYWYERRRLLKMMYEKYKKGGITALVLMDAFKCDRLKPITSAYNRMYGKVPKVEDSRQMRFEFGFAGLIEEKKSEGQTVNK